MKMEEINRKIFRKTHRDSLIIYSSLAETGEQPTFKAMNFIQDDMMNWFSVIDAHDGQHTCNTCIPIILSMFSRQIPAS